MIFIKYFLQVQIGQSQKKQKNIYVTTNHAFLNQEILDTISTIRQNNEEIGSTDGLDWANQSGPNHICVILSRLCNTMYHTAWYFILGKFLNWKIYLRDVLPLKLCLGKSSKKNYLDREIVPIPSDPPTIETVSEYLDSEYW